MQGTCMQAVHLMIIVMLSLQLRNVAATTHVWGHSKHEHHCLHLFWPLATCNDARRASRIGCHFVGVLNLLSKLQYHIECMSQLV